MSSPPHEVFGHVLFMKFDKSKVFSKVVIDIKIIFIFIMKKWYLQIDIRLISYFKIRSESNIIQKVNSKLRWKIFFRSFCMILISYYHSWIFSLTRYRCWSTWNSICITLLVVELKLKILISYFIIIRKKDNFSLDHRNVDEQKSKWQMGFGQRKESSLCNCEGSKFRWRNFPSPYTLNWTY